MTGSTTERHDRGAGEALRTPSSAADVLDAPSDGADMSDVTVERKAGMTRADVAQWIADVTKALSGDRTVTPEDAAGA